MRIRLVETGVQVLSVMEGTPAEEAGLEDNDVIVEIDDQTTIGLNQREIVRRLRGPLRSTVNLGVSRDEAPTTIDIQVVRAHIVPQTVKYARLGNIAHIRVSGFNQSTTRSLREKLKMATSEVNPPLSGIVLDLRGNPGGLLSAAVHVSDRFIEEGRIVSTRGRNADQNLSYSANRIGTWDIPLVLLIDKGSAGASGIVAGATRDHHRGQIVGRQSFGKWSVQTIYPGAWSTGLRVTTAKFYSPNGDNWSKIGIRPDVEVPLAAAAPAHRSSTDLDVDGDDDIQAALSILREPQFTRR